MADTTKKRKRPTDGEDIVA